LNENVSLFLISAVICYAIVKLFVNLVNPPSGWDSINYHFTFAVEWLKHANLTMPPTVFDDPSPTYYPINGSLFYLWFIMPLRNVFLADLGQVPFYILSVLSVYSIARKCGLNKNYAIYSAGLFLLIPNFFKQLQIAYVDVMVAGLFLACVNFLLEARLNFSWPNIIGYSMSLGLLLGTKTVAMPYSALLFLPFTYLWLKNKWNISYLIFVLTAVLSLGGFSYIRNYLEAGNPLYPLNFTIFGKPIFKGVMDSVVYRAHFKIGDYSLSKALFHEGLGLQTLVFILPGIFLALPLAIKKRKGLDFVLVYFMLLPLLLYFVYRYLIPLANLRYLYCLLGIGIVLGFYVAERLKIPKGIISLAVIVCVIASMTELAKRQELVTAAILSVLTFVLLLIFRTKIKFNILSSRNSGIIFMIILASFLAISERWYLKNEFSRYSKMTKYSGFWPEATEAWDWLNRSTKGDNIAYAGRPVPFPLYGSSFKNNVYYVSVNKTDPAMLHYYPHGKYEWGDDFESEHKNFAAPGNYRADADYNVWLNNLKSRNIDYLFVYSLHQTKDIIFPIEDSWAAANPQKFQTLFFSKSIHVYKVIE
jgi:hypothetical protein